MHCILKRVLKNKKSFKRAETHFILYAYAATLCRQGLYTSVPM